MTLTDDHWPITTPPIYEFKKKFFSENLSVILVLMGLWNIYNLRLVGSSQTNHK